MRPQDNPFLRDPAETKRVNKIIWQNSSWPERIRMLALEAFILFPIMAVAITLGGVYALLTRLGLDKPTTPPPAYLADQLLTPEKVDAYLEKQKRRRQKTQQTKTT